MARLQSMRGRAGHVAGVRNDLHPAPGHPNEGVAEVNTRIKGVIEGMGGKILKLDNWGKRQLAYEVEKQLKGIYLYWQYLGDAGRRRRDRAQPAHARQGHPLLHGQGRRERRLAARPSEHRRRDVQQGRLDGCRRGGAVPHARRRDMSRFDEDDDESPISMTTSCRRRRRPSLPSPSAKPGKE